MFGARARDAAGNVDASPAERSWKVDATRPTVKTVSPAAKAAKVAPTANVLATFSEAMRANNHQDHG